MVQEALTVELNNFITEKTNMSKTELNKRKLHRKNAHVKDADVRRFLREDLSPLMENRELLKAYLGMMVEG